MQEPKKKKPATIANGKGIKAGARSKKTSENKPSPKLDFYKNQLDKSMKSGGFTPRDSSIYSDMKSGKRTSGEAYRLIKKNQEVRAQGRNLQSKMKKK